MWKLAGWEQSPVAAQGTTRWYLSGAGNLSELALRLVDNIEGTEEG
jgi:hypothetical protein